MNIWIYISLLIVTSWLLYTPMKHSLLMFQQNRYEIHRYIPWLTTYLKTGWRKGFYSLIGMILIAVFLVIPQGIWQWIYPVGIMLLLSLVLAYLEKNKTYIKPLVITHRVIRQWIIFYLIILAILSLGWWLSPIWWAILAFVLFYGVWLLLLLMAFITEPIENGVKQVYIWLAKRKLKKHSQLIKIGITGSYGKTTSKNILYEILSSEFYTLKTPASYNTPMGITITIRNYLKSLHQVFIVEMGADKVNEINYLTKMVKPQFGMVTAVGPQHLNTFKSIDNILNEKMKMIENLPLSGVGVINVDNEYIRNYRIKNKCQVIKVGLTSSDADVRATNIRYTPELTTFDIVTSDQVSIPFQTKLLGEHNVLNIAMSVALARHLGIDWVRLQKAVSAMLPVENRLQTKQMFGYTVIDNAFNSNPVSAKNSLDVLAMMPNKRIIITPGMIDLGNQQDLHNKQFGAYMKNRADVALLIGKKQTAPIVAGLKESGFDMTQVIVVSSLKEAFDWINKHGSKQDTILIENDLPDAFIA